MDIIIVCHTEFGLVRNRRVIADKNAIDGVRKGVSNLVKIATRFDAKITFAVMPEVVEYFPRDADHEIGLHIHAGWQESQQHGIKYYVGDSYLREHCKQFINSTVLRDYPYEEQLEMIKTGRDHLLDVFGIEPKSFVAGKWCINDDTVKALAEIGITHECSACAHSKSDHYDWSKLPRICMPYHPSKGNYQEKGDSSLLIIPISQMFFAGNISPEAVPTYGLSWLKACFLEYYEQELPLFHICLHSSIVTDPYFICAMDDFLDFVSKHNNVNFIFASEIRKYNEVSPRTRITPYLLAINSRIIKTYSTVIKSKLFGVKNE